MASWYLFGSPARAIKKFEFFMEFSQLSSVVSYRLISLILLKTEPRVSRAFCMFLPHEIELWTLDRKSLEGMKKECVNAVLYIVILEYSLYSKLSCCIRFIQGEGRGGVVVVRFWYLLGVQPQKDHSRSCSRTFWCIEQNREIMSCFIIGTS